MPVRLLFLLAFCAVAALSVVSPYPRPEPAAAANVAQLAAGGVHTCALLPVGTVKCWGDNSSGQLGDGTTTQRNTPVDVCASGSGAGCGGGSVLSSVIRITAGEYHTCAVIFGGGVKCWGYNAWGQLGDGTTTDRLNPVAVCASGSGVGCAGGSALGGAVKVDAGVYHTCALMSDTSLKCWGYNLSGQLGDGTTTDRSNPVDVCASGSGAGCAGGSALTGVSLPGGGFEHSCALMAGGSVKCWGDNAFSQLGDGNSPTDGANPVDVVGNSITTPDTTGDVGHYTSVVVDTSGRPVVSYYDQSNGDLKVVHCGDATCSAGNSIAAPDTGGDVGQYTSLRLDASGNPVVSYFDVTNGNLKLLHCGNADCTSGNSITSPDTAGTVGIYTSLVLDSSGYPVVGYGDFLFNAKILHCGNASCTSGNSIAVGEAGAMAGSGGPRSVALDGAGNPVAAYERGGILRVLHCGDTNCTSGNSLTTPGPSGNYAALALDSSGYPVVSYRKTSVDDLYLLHCNDANCSGGDESDVAVDTTNYVGEWSGIALDPSGNPIVSYLDRTNYDLRVVHCGDANCSSGNTFATIDGANQSGVDASLALDASGQPVVSYIDFLSLDLRVLHCAGVNCSDPLTGATWVAAGQYHNCAVVTGGEVRCWGSNNFGQLGDNSSTESDTPVSVCQDEGCFDKLTGAIFVGAGAGHTCVSVSGNSAKCWGQNFFGQLSDGNAPNDSDAPRNVCADAACSAPVSNLLPGGGDVGRYHGCARSTAGNVQCAGDNALGQLGDGTSGTTSDTAVNVVGLSGKGAPTETLGAPDTGEDVGLSTSLMLDASGNPVVSYYDIGNGDLKVLHCNDANCTGGGESITAPDTTGTVGAYSSLALDASGNPVVSYADITSFPADGDLKVLHCNDPNCSGGDESITTPDSSSGLAGGHTSLALDASGYPVVSYYDATNGVLKVLHCNDANCAGGDESIDTGDDGGGKSTVGFYTSLALDGADNPVVSYYDSTQGDLRVARSGDGYSSTAADTPGDVGQWTSLALDAFGHPVVSYKDATNENLKVLHCGNADCDSDNNAIASVAAVGPVGPIGHHTSLELDASGNPVIAYYEAEDGDLNVARCGDPFCLGGTTIAAPDTSGDVGQHASLALDASDNPVISYYDATNGDLKVLHCVDPACSGTPAPLAVTTLVGTGIAEDCASGDATECAVNGPRGLFRTDDAAYLADSVNCRVKEIGGGQVTTIAGLGPDLNCGYDGEGTAADKKLNNPYDVFLQGTDLYVADTDNCRLRKVNLSKLTPMITTVVGTDCNGTSTDGPVASATLDHPAGVAVADDGTIYIAERDGCKIRKVSGGSVSTIVGTGTCAYGGDGGPGTAARLNHPYDVAFLSPGNGLVIADRDNDRVRFYNLATGIITTMAGNGVAGFSGDGGSATNAQLHSPEAVDSADYQVLIADALNDRVRIVDTIGGTIRTFIGEGGVTDGKPYPHPSGVAMVAIGAAGAGGVGEGATGAPPAPATGSVSACSFDGANCEEVITDAGIGRLGEETSDVQPSQPCGMVPGVSSIDFALPALVAGMILFRRRIGGFFIRLRTGAEALAAWAVRRRLQNGAGIEAAR